MSILIKNILHENKIADILIKKNKIEEIAESINEKADTIIDGSDKAALPGFVNGHTHAAMTLLRGYGDDMVLKEWLETKIWPIEAKMTEEDIYWGVKLACLEMIKTGTTCFNDMYWHFSAMAKATDEMGLRAALAETFIDIAGEKQAKESKEKTEKAFKESSDFSDRIKFAIAPHAIYTVSRDSLEWLKHFADKHELLI
ncbi:hypothetical protein A2Y83_00495 [Candidatus Falkowbacteria bacterium RBG_13_39_14]|uniref:Amidohydrolase-related domain-containing protein n=1 Tax=Candidatus Falkowbacteria bacterium RBG_13_39_14 TaxID=1797985 RepID=A0A1F5S7Q4_9BACT|nr:MAG: hypothetical protein A2Y83_00495 [Candidatus Falkowbacteria bacterium RBG_13_39_14]